MCEVTGSSRSYVITDGALKELIKPFYTFTDCVCSLLCDIGPRRNHSPVRYTSITKNHYVSGKLIQLLTICVNLESLCYIMIYSDLNSKGRSYPKLQN